METTTYRGRFAPSPTGPLHFGSLVTAVGSFLDARSQGGTWQVRLDDLDEPRVKPGAEAAILATLEAYGFQWDGEVVRQSGRSEAYRAAFGRLAALGAVYPCACTRREIADSSLNPSRAIYPGTCRNGLPPGRLPRAFRVRTEAVALVFEDLLQGKMHMHLAEEVGDFIVWRADGYTAYQLATVVDDHDLGITHVVRGADLLDSTFRQIHLQRLLGLPTPAYLPLPVVVNGLGEKLSKQTLAPPLDARHASRDLWAALRFLGQEPPAELFRAPVRELWGWAAAHWSRAKLPAIRSAPLEIAQA